MRKTGRCVSLRPNILQKMSCLSADLVGDLCTLFTTEGLAATEFPIHNAPNFPHLPSLKRPQGLLLLQIGKAAPSLSVQTLQTLPKSLTHKDEALCTISVRSPRNNSHFNPTGFRSFRGSFYARKQQRQAEDTRDDCLPLRPGYLSLVPG